MVYTDNGQYEFCAALDNSSNPDHTVLVWWVGPAKESAPLGPGVALVGLELRDEKLPKPKERPPSYLGRVHLDSVVCTIQGLYMEMGSGAVAGTLQEAEWQRMMKKFAAFENWVNNNH